MTPNSERLIKDIKSAVEDAEVLIRETAGKTGKDITALHASMTDRLAVAKDKLLEAEHEAVAKAKHAAQVTDQYVHENPWQSAIIAGSLGFLVGYLASASRH